jgi:ABC-type branched-subunit amino acid transport system ATPase component
VRALDDVSLCVLPWQTVSIIGPNGSGKTTLFNLIGGMLEPDGGEISFDGRRITGLAPERIAALGIARTFQNGRVFGNMTVRENILIGLHTRMRAARPFARLRHLPFLRWIALLAETAQALLRPARVRREETEIADEARRELRRFGERLLPRQDAPAFSLSYANRRRTEIARALAMSPRLLLLDEPTAGMNPTETDEMLGQIRALRAEGYSILLIEHKLNLVMALSDHIVVLDDGRVIAAGTPAEVQADARVIDAYLGGSPRRRTGGAAPEPGLPFRADDPHGTPVPGPRPAPLLLLDGIDAFYGPIQALSHVSLRVDRGEIVCLLGGNASGKSTTMKVILGLLHPRAGRVALGGEDVTLQSTTDRIRRGLASVPEARRVFPEMTVLENLLMGAYLRRDGAGIGEDIDRMFEICPAPAGATTPAGGDDERRRAADARDGAR